MKNSCHCEEQTRTHNVAFANEAIQLIMKITYYWIASHALAMTNYIAALRCAM